MGKAVKKVATIAATAAAVYYGGKALMASNIFGPQSVGPVSKFVGGIHKGIAGVKAGIGASLFGASTLQKVGLGLQGISYMQQRKFASAQASATKQAAEEQRRINEMQERVRLVQERRQRLDIVRQQRIQQGTIEAGTAAAGLGMQGTSGFIGATGAIQTQATANLEAINMASGASTAISQASQRQADYTTDAYTAKGMATQWSAMGDFGAFANQKAPEIFSIFK